MQKKQQKRKRLGELLIDAGLIDEKILEDALAAQKVQDKKLGEVLVEMEVVDDIAIARAISSQLNIPFVRLGKVKIPDEILSRVSQELAVKYEIIPLKEVKGRLIVAMANPLLHNAIDDLRFVTRQSIATAVSPMADVTEALERFYPKQDIKSALETAEGDIDGMDYVPQLQEEEKSDMDLASLAVKAPVIRFTNAILADAIKIKASDVHIEPQKSETGKANLTVRCRVDGIMRETMQTDRHVHPPLISRLKVISGLDISVRRKPQDGKAQVRFEDKVFDLRVSTIPTTYGEKATIRILNPDTAKMLPEDLGFSEIDLQAALDSISIPQGMILVTGPTGSGKSSTLYAFLNRLNTPTVNIITVEDPVEFDVSGINQVQINAKAGITFAAGLRSILRQDPDIVMLGEIRDGETAEIAFQAAQTGHLVLSTLHTNDAPSAVTRLIDLGVDEFQISSALIAAIGQRLVRRIHTHCKTEDTLSDRVRQRLQPYFEGGAVPPFHRGEGCKGCFGTGYSGRLGLYEIFRMSPGLRDLIGPGQPATALKSAAQREGFRTLSQDGIIKAAQGLTSLEEVFRVAPPDIQAPESGPRPVPIDRESMDVDRDIRTESESPRFTKKLPPGLVQAMAKISPPAEPLAFAEDDGEDAAPDAPMVLVVDDNEIIRLTICDALESQDYSVLTAEDGQEAIETVSEEKPDLIVTDYMMPRMDGIEFIRKMKAEPALQKIPIIMLTAKDDAESAVKVLKAGADEYLTKPVNRKLFLESVEKLMKG